MLPGPCTAWSLGFTGDTALPPSLLMLVINNNRTVSQCHKLGLTGKLCLLTDRPQEVQNAIIIKINILEGIFLPTRSSQTLSVTRGVTSAEIRVWLSIHQQGTSRPKCPAQWEVPLSLCLKSFLIWQNTPTELLYTLDNSPLLSSVVPQFVPVPLLTWSIVPTFQLRWGLTKISLNWNNIDNVCLV